MRPCELTISGFGPYANKVKIDFQKFNTQGLYLISGDTGAGKTTIFDAITYALFGLPSGEVREVGGLRSKYADIDTPTFVCLEFEIKGELYQIRRNPEYLRRAKKGTGTTKESASCELTLPNGVVLTRNADVHAKIKEILGLDRNQFSQICMIAQGDFLKLLLADTKQRQEIFRDLFKTEMYDEVSKRLKEEYHQVSQAYEQTKQSLSQYLKDVEGDDVFVSKDLEKLKQNALPPEDSLQLLATLCDQGEVKLKKAEVDLDGVEQTIKGLERRKQAAKEWQKVTERRNVTKNQMHLIKQKLDMMQVDEKEERELEAAKQAMNDVQKAMVYIANHRRFLTESHTLKQIQETYESQQAKLECLNVQREETEVILKNLEDVKLEKTKVEYRLTQIKQSIRAIRAILEIEKDVVQKKEAFLLQTKKYENSKDEYSKMEMELLRLRNLYADNIAGVLAKDLKENLPCPVCGSTSHPNPAKYGKTLVTKEGVERFEKRKNESLEKLNAEVSETARKKAMLSEREEQCIHASKEELARLMEIKWLLEQPISGDVLMESDNNTFAIVLANAHSAVDNMDKLRSSMVCVGTNLQTLMAMYQEEQNILSKKEDKKKQTEMMLQKLKESHRHQGEYLEKLHQQIQTMQRNVFAMEGSLQSQKAELSLFLTQFNLDENRVEFAQDLQNLQADLERKIETIRHKQEEYASLRETSMVLHTSWKEQSEQSKRIADKLELSSPDIQDINHLLQIWESELAQENIRKEERLNQVKFLSSMVSINKRALQNIEKNREEQIRIERRMQMLKSLSDTANGTVSGKDKLMLETFVQMSYFESVIRKANIRFMLMTSGQFELKRKEEGASLRNRTGLELDVIDHYNGSVRSVKTLSGGESFKASLSLALGLADEVQERAGGIHLNAMFVDEGFGSLDSDSLSQALKALSDLTLGNRLVGIISHVGELKQRIDKQILVKKNRENGSSVELVY